LNLLLQESCAIANMTARCALYKWIEWAVADMAIRNYRKWRPAASWIWCNRK